MSEIEVVDGDLMARPWSLGVVAVGLAVGLVTALMTANNAVVDPVRMSILTSLSAAIGLLMMASGRDRFGPSLGALVLSTGAGMAAVQWISPYYADGTARWDTGEQLALTALGFANGVLLAALLALALLRRAPTLTVAATIAAGVAVLAADTILLRTVWPRVVVLVAAVAACLLAWDQSPAIEASFRPGLHPARTVRAALSLATVVCAGAAIELWWSGDRSQGNPFPAVIIAALLLLVAFAALVGVRREIQQRETTLAEWRAWFREGRTGDFESELAGSDTGVGDLIGRPPRPLSFPNLGVADPTQPLPTDPAQPIPTAPTLPTDPAQPVEPLPTTTTLPTAPTTGTPQPVPTAAAPPGDNEPALRWADDLAEAAAPTTAAASGGPGAFSAWIGDPEPQVATLDDLAGWLVRTQGQLDRLVAAVETMPLADFDTLPGDVRTAMTHAMSELLQDISPEPTMIAPVDGPYLMLTWDRIGPERLGEINSTLLATLATPVDTAHGAVALDGAVALIRVDSTLTVETLIDDAIVGLVRARHNIDLAAR